jgi:hypothetical protein
MRDFATGNRECSLKKNITLSKEGSVDDTRQAPECGSQLAWTMNMPRYNKPQCPRHKTTNGIVMKSFRSHKAMLYWR